MADDFSAEDANKEADDYNEAQNTYETKIAEVLTKIEEEAKKGKYTLALEEELPRSVIDKLWDLDFNIDRLEEKNPDGTLDVTTKITWWESDTKKVTSIFHHAGTHTTTSS